MPDDATSISLPELHQVLQDYINRNESELVELAAERANRTWRKAEGKGKRETELEKLREDEQNQYKVGFGRLFSLLRVSTAEQALTRIYRWCVLRI